MTKRVSTKLLTEAGILIALGTILSFIKVYEAPTGGSITAGSMIPIILFALRWGTVPGLTIGIVYGMLQFIADPQFYHPIQFLLDYPVAFGFLGLAGIAKFKTNRSTTSEYILLALGVFFAIAGRFISHLLSGVVFFAEYAGDMNPWLYSTIYNIGYLLPEFLISVIILMLIWKPIKKL